MVKFLSTRGLVLSAGHRHVASHFVQGCGNTMPDLSDLVPFHAGQVENFNLLVLGQV